MRTLPLLFALSFIGTGTASAQPLPPPGGGGLGSSSGVATLFTYGSSSGVGNGADTTEDTLLTYSIPAATLKVTGDRLRIFINGSFAGSTDAKSARVRLNGTLFLTVNGATASTTTWQIYLEVQKTGANTQYTASNGLVNNTSPALSTGPGSLTDTAAIALTVTGQNNTTAAANTITVKYVAVEYLP